MHKILIDEEAWAALNQWAAEHPGVIKACWNRAYLDNMEIRFGKSDMIAYAQQKKVIWKISLKLDGQVRVKLDITAPEDSEHDFGVHYGLTHPDSFEYSEESLTALSNLAEFAASAVLNINAYLIYGNAYEDRPVILTGKNDGNKKTIVFRLFEGKTYAVATTAHRSPEGIFSVRGHFRRYKSGKVIWIDEYLKGIEKEERKKK